MTRLERKIELTREQRMISNNHIEIAHSAIFLR
jgi:hypothetical protein